MTSLASKIAVSAGYGFRMAIVLQNISQLDEYSATIWVRRARQSG
jgi:type IV secretory pathway TraG/TraD family ATPase VirD4